MVVDAAGTLRRSCPPRFLFLVMSLFTSTNDGGATALENQRQANIQQGQGQIDSAFAAFNPKFYQNYQQTVLGAETPQLDQQYQNTSKNLTYALARGGSLNGSVAQQEGASLNHQMATNEGEVAGQAAGATNQLQDQVQGQKSNLTQELVQGGNPSSIAEGATAAASQDRAPSAIQPLGNLFADWSNQYLAGQNAAAYGAQAQSNNPLSAILNASYGTS